MGTLTEMLTQQHLKSFREATLVGAIPLEEAKLVFKKWLKTVGLPDYITENKSTTQLNINITESLRQLLIILVDEP